MTKQGLIALIPQLREHARFPDETVSLRLDRPLSSQPRAPPLAARDDRRSENGCMLVGTIEVLAAGAAEVSPAMGPVDETEFPSAQRGPLRLHAAHAIPPLSPGDHVPPHGAAKHDLSLR